MLHVFFYALFTIIFYSYLVIVQYLLTVHNHYGNNVLHTYRDDLTYLKSKLRVSSTHDRQIN